MALRALLLGSMAWLCAACPIPERCPDGVRFTYQGCTQEPIGGVVAKPTLRNGGTARLELEILQPLVPYIVDCERLEREPQLASALSWRDRPGDNPEHVTLAPGAVHELYSEGAGDCGLVQLRLGDGSATRFVILRPGASRCACRRPPFRSTRATAHRSATRRFRCSAGPISQRRSTSTTRSRRAGTK